jgi:hypothetical protein
MVSMASTLIYFNWKPLASASPPKGLMCNITNPGFRLYLSRRKTKRMPRSVKGKAGRSESWGTSGTDRGGTAARVRAWDAVRIGLMIGMREKERGAHLGKELVLIR